MITILEVLIPALALIVVQLIVSVTSQRRNDLKYDMTLSELKKDIGRLEIKQDKHNQILERFAVMEQAQKTQWIRIDEIREELKQLRDKI